MTARDVEQSLGRDVFGQEVMAHNRRVGALAALASPRGDPAHGGDAGKALGQGRFCCANALRASTARTLTRCRGVARPPRSWAPRNALPSTATTPVSLSPLALAKVAMKRRNASSKASGLSRRNTRLNVSWLGMPCSRPRKSRNSPSFDRPNSSISAHCPLPHTTAASATNSTSSRSCLALPARGSGNCRKDFLNLCIRPPP